MESRSPTGKLPNWIRHKNVVLNLKSPGFECFKWAFLAGRVGTRFFFKSSLSFPEFWENIIMNFPESWENIIMNIPEYCVENHMFSLSFLMTYRH